MNTERRVQPEQTTYSPFAKTEEAITSATTAEKDVLALSELMLAEKASLFDLKRLRVAAIYCVDLLRAMRSRLSSVTALNEDLKKAREHLNERLRQDRHSAEQLASAMSVIVAEDDTTPVIIQRCLLAFERRHKPCANPGPALQELVYDCSESLDLKYDERTASPIDQLTVIRDVLHNLVAENMDEVIRDDQRLEKAVESIAHCLGINFASKASPLEKLEACQAVIYRETRRKNERYDQEKETAARLIAEMKREVARLERDFNLGEAKQAVIYDLRGKA